MSHGGNLLLTSYGENCHGTFIAGRGISIDGVYAIANSSITRSDVSVKKICSVVNLLFNYLQIRLLTRMGRYSEMTYVFDILREHQQFELLFNKGIDKVHQLN